MADAHEDPIEIARDILSAERDCSVCGGDGLHYETPGTKCVCCRGERKVKVYGPNVRVLAQAFICEVARQERPGQ